MTNEPEWAYVGATLSIAEKLLQHEDETLESKAEMIRWLQARYKNDLAVFNAAWDLQLEDWQDLKHPFPVDWKQSEAAAQDIQEFSRILITQYNKIPALACKKVDKEHLNMGMRYAWVYNADQVAGCEYFDVFDINCYDFEPKAYLDWVGELVQMPVMISEFHHGALDRGLPVTGIQGVRTQKERGLAYRHYMENAAQSPWFLGAIHFVINDQQILCNSGQENYNIGLVDCCQRPYDDMVEQLIACNHDLYAIADGQKPALTPCPESIPSNAF